MKKVIILTLMFASTVVFLPAVGYSAVENYAVAPAGEPQVRVQTNRGRRNRNWNRGLHRGWRNRGWYDNRRRTWYYNNRNNSRTRLVRQYYWSNGRRQVRYVRVRY